MNAMSPNDVGNFGTLEEFGEKLHQCIKPFQPAKVPI